MSGRIQDALSFKEWGERFEMDSDQRESVAKYATRLLGDPMLQMILNSMEYNILEAWRATPTSDKEALELLKAQMNGIKALRVSLKAFASAETIAEFNASN